MIQHVLKFPGARLTAKSFVWLTLVIFACRADVIDDNSVQNQPGLPPDCSVFADWVATYTLGGDPDNQIVAQAALGAPDDVAIPLTKDAVLTVGFLGLGAITDSSGNDIRVHHSSDSNATIAVYCGDNQDDIPYCGEISPSNRDVDISQGSQNSAIFIRLVGLDGQSQIDAFEALQTVCIDNR